MPRRPAAHSYGACETTLSAWEQTPPRAFTGGPRQTHRPWSCSWPGVCPAAAFLAGSDVQGTEPRGLSHNHVVRLLLRVLADVICCLYYLVKMLISQPQRGLLLVGCAAFLGMLESRPRLCAMLAEVLTFLTWHQK